MLIVFTTAPSIADADVLAQKIVEAKLAACVQILPQMTSIYVWQGKLQKENEHLVLIKTLPEKWDELRDFISDNHSYDVPEIAALDVEKISEPYKIWLTDMITESEKGKTEK